MKKPIKSKDELKTELSEEAYRVTQEAGTELPFTGQYYDFDKDGSYNCICCGETLFLSTSKFNASCGWPSFDSPTSRKTIKERRDSSLGMERTEVVCSNCDAHLGHVFTDGPTETGLRYCINSVALDFKEKDSE